MYSVEYGILWYKNNKNDKGYRPLSFVLFLYFIAHCIFAVYCKNTITALAAVTTSITTLKYQVQYLYNRNRRHMRIFISAEATQ